MTNVPGEEKREIITFEAGRARKRGARMVAAFLDYPDLSTMLNTMLDEVIGKHFPQMLREIEAQDPKARSRRQARKKAG